MYTSCNEEFQVLLSKCRKFGGFVSIQLFKLIFSFFNSLFILCVSPCTALASKFSCCADVVISLERIWCCCFVFFFSIVYQPTNMTMTILHCKTAIDKMSNISQKKKKIYRQRTLLRHRKLCENCIFQSRCMCMSPVYSVLTTFWAIEHTEEIARP